MDEALCRWHEVFILWCHFWQCPLHEQKGRDILTKVVGGFTIRLTKLAVCCARLYNSTRWPISLLCMNGLRKHSFHLVGLRFLGHFQGEGELWCELLLLPTWFRDHSTVVSYLNGKKVYAGRGLSPAQRTTTVVPIPNPSDMKQMTRLSLHYWLTVRAGDHPTTHCGNV